MSARLACIALLIAFMWGCHSSEGSQPVEPNRVYTSADVDKALDDAKTLADEGKYAEALERHLWYHENALKYAPEHAGVRLSFALGSWTELGAKYPKAIDELKRVRDETFAKYLNSKKDFELFGDVIFIDVALRDWTSAKTHLKHGSSRASSLDSILILSIEKIVEDGEEAWAREIIGDPKQRLAKMILERESMQASLRNAPESVADTHDRFFVESCVPFLAAVKTLYGNDKAREIQREALKVVNDPKIRAAI